MDDDNLHPLIENTDFNGFNLVAKWFIIGAICMILFVTLI
jgi:hypothetical protein